MKFTLGEYKKWLTNTLVSIRKNKEHISYLSVAIDKAKNDIPELKKQIAHYEKMLPKWEKDLHIQKITLISNLERVKKNTKKYELAQRIENSKRKLRNLDTEIRKQG